jgi:transcriptional regulator with XRE-family HTH domain
METRALDMPELRGLGRRLRRLRRERGMSQGRLAGACGVSQAQISLFESGRRLPSLEQLLGIARALDTPLEELFHDDGRAASGLGRLAVELRRLGAWDLWVSDAVVPAAARRPEEVIALAVSGPRPDPRVVATLPALLSWNEIDASMLKIHGRMTRTTYRLAWLADVALAVDRRTSFPGGCRRASLARFLKRTPLPREDSPCDDLGMPSPSPLPSLSPIWRRWKISAGMTLEDFAGRARELAALRADRKEGRDNGP